jgi:nicotinate-nucleotide adenylyltransferase
MQTLTHFQKQFHVKYIIIGADNLASIQKWHDFKRLNEQIIWLIATRENHELKTAILRDFRLLQIDVNISSTEIREKTGKKEPNDPK